MPNSQRHTMVLLFIATSWACDGSIPEQITQDSTQARVQELTGNHVVFARDGREQLLTGVPEPVPPATDAYRVITLDKSPQGLELDGARVLDARLVPDGAVTIGSDRVLRHHTRESIRELDTEALGPLSIEAGKVAYVRGEAPDLRLRIVDLSTGRSDSPVPHLAPAWSPALSEDGREIIFAASAEGRPQLFRYDAAGALHRLDADGRTPSSPVAPTWRGSELTFLDEAGEVRLNLETGQVDHVEPK